MAGTAGKQSGLQWLPELGHSLSTQALIGRQPEMPCCTGSLLQRIKTLNLSSDLFYIFTYLHFPCRFISQVNLQLPTLQSLVNVTSQAHITFWPSFDSNTNAPCTHSKFPTDTREDTSQHGSVNVKCRHTNAEYLANVCTYSSQTCCCLYYKQHGLRLKMNPTATGNE